MFRITLSLLLSVCIGTPGAVLAGDAETPAPFAFNLTSPRPDPDDGIAKVQLDRNSPPPQVNFEVSYDPVPVLGSSNLKCCPANGQHSCTFVSGPFGSTQNYNAIDRGGGDIYASKIKTFMQAGKTSVSLTYFCSYVPKTAPFTPSSTVYSGTITWPILVLPDKECMFIPPDNMPCCGQWNNPVQCCNNKLCS
jgi:hypothetical protein